MCRHLPNKFAGFGIRPNSSSGNYSFWKKRQGRNKQEERTDRPTYIFLESWERQSPDWLLVQPANREIGVPRGRGMLSECCCTKAPENLNLPVEPPEGAPAAWHFRKVLRPGRQSSAAPSTHLAPPVSWSDAKYRPARGVGSFPRPARFSARSKFHSVFGECSRLAYPPLAARRFWGEIPHAPGPDCPVWKNY